MERVCADAETIQIFVKPLVVACGWKIVECQPLTLYVAANETVSNAKAKIEHKGGFPVAQIGMLMYLGTPLTDDRTLSDYKIKKDSTLHFWCVLGNRL